VITDPASSTANVTQSFNVTISVASVTDLYAWQVKILFNQTVIECSGAFYPPDQVFAGKVTSPVTPVIQNSSGYVQYGNSLQGDVSGINGDGKLCVITFIGKDIGTSSLKFSLAGQGYSYLLDSTLSEITTQFQDGTVNVVPEFSNVAMMIAFVALSSVVAVLLKGKTRIQQNLH
jgi:hypothetical protein